MSSLGIAYGSYYGTSSNSSGALVAIMDPQNVEAGQNQVTVAIANGQPAEPVGLALDNVAWPQVAALSAALSTSAAITSLPVAALPAALASGAVVWMFSGSNYQSWVLNGAAAQGATSITVNSQTPNFAYPSGTAIGSSLTLDTYSQAIYTNTLPNLAAGSHTLKVVGVTSGYNDIAFPVKWGALNTASDVISITPPTRTAQTKWRLYDPRVSVYTPGQTARVNLAQRPRGDSYGAAGEWAVFNSYGHGNYSLLTGQTTPISGLTTAVRKTTTTADAAGGVVQLTAANPDSATTAAANLQHVSPGASYTISAYVRPTRADTLTTASQINYRWYDIAGNAIGGAIGAAGASQPSGAWTRQSLTVTAPSGAAGLAVYVWPLTAPAVNDTIDVTALLVEKSGTLGSYFDGSFTATDTIYAWAGTAGDSASILMPGFWQFINNPTKWTSPGNTKTITHVSTPPIGGQILAWESGTKPEAYEFSGTILTQDEYVELKSWSDRPNRFWLIDHRNKARLVSFTNFDHQPANIANSPWAGPYTMHLLQFTAV